jgi:CubicO group peptidase (beta-lactamase class C family)
MPPTPDEQHAYDQAPAAWPTDPQGYQVGFGGLKLSARDLAKFGYLYLNGGRWDRTQVVPADLDVRCDRKPSSRFRLSASGQPRPGPHRGHHTADGTGQRRSAILQL